MRVERVASLLLLALACVATPALADWRKDYDLGLKALDEGRYADAGAAFRSALAEDPQPNARKRFQGVVVKLYVPHYYAAVSAWRQGDCAQALEFWGNAASAAVVAGQPELKATQDRGIAECTRTLAATGKPGSGTATTQSPASQPVSSTTAGTTPSSTASSSQSRPQASTQPATQPTTTRPAQTTPSPAAVPAPAALVTLVDAWLAGDYTRIARSDPATLPDARARAHGFLLRAAARHTLAGLGDEAQREAARADVRAARAASASLSPDETLFSPRFRAFWKETR